MSLFKRAFLSLSRHKGKTILLFVILSLLSTVSATAIVANRTVNQTSAQIVATTPTVVTLGLNEEYLSNHFSEFEILMGITGYQISSLNYETIQAINDLPYVANFTSSFNTVLVSNINPYIPSDDYTGLTVEDSGLFFLGEIGFPTQLGIVGIEDDPIEFNSGIFSLTEGNLFDYLNHQYGQNYYPILISRELAAVNELTLGSSFTAYQQQFMDSQWNIKSYDLKIVGIFEIDYNVPQHDEAFFLQFLLYNNVFMPNMSVSQIFNDINDSWESYFYYAGWDNFVSRSPLLYWELWSPLYIDSFRLAVQELLPYYLDIEDGSHIFSPLQNNMEFISTLSNQALIFTITSTIIIISLLITLYLSDRRQELGIYLALGENKIKIIFQLIFEVVVIGVICFSLSLLVGNVVANNLSHEFLLQELTTRYYEGPQEIYIFDPVTGFEIPLSNTPSMLEFSGMVRELNVDEFMSLLDISLNGSTIAIFFLVGITTLIISSIVPVAYFLEMKPKEILMKGNVK